MRRLVTGRGPVRFEPGQIAELRALYYATGSGQEAAWSPWADAHLKLPDWFRRGLDPLEPAYREQQLRLWRLITGLNRDYEPELHEKEMGWESVDPIRKPGYYLRRDPQAVRAAGDHWLATGMVLQHSGLVAGDRALEYGAGFGQTALALARLGVRVDTVDISPAFCQFVQQQADFFQVPLQAHQGRFGYHPRPGESYRLIWFYEAFHHCLDFLALVPQLHAMLAPGGRVILAGEPVVESVCEALPYPWGVRLHSEVAAVMRETAWMELGFNEDFLMGLFRRHGFEGSRIDCEPSTFGRLYVFDKPGVAATTS